jgi:Uncharacterized protein conserved in bacteria
MFRQRKGLIVWVSDVKGARALEKYGSLHYVSKRMKYAVLYIDSDQEAAVSAQLKKLPFVKRIEPSYRDEIKTEYSREFSDKSQFYSL